MAIAGNLSRPYFQSINLVRCYLLLCVEIVNRGMDFASDNHAPADFSNANPSPKLSLICSRLGIQGSPCMEGLNLEVELATDPSFLGPVAMEIAEYRGGGPTTPTNGEALSRQTSWAKTCRHKRCGKVDMEVACIGQGEMNRNGVSATGLQGPHCEIHLEEKFLSKARPALTSL